MQRDTQSVSQNNNNNIIKGKNAAEAQSGAAEA